MFSFSMEWFRQDMEKATLAMIRLDQEATLKKERTAQRKNRRLDEPK